MMKFSLDIELTDSQIDDIIEDKKKENKIILKSEIKTIKSRIKEYQGDVKNFHKKQLKTKYIPFFMLIMKIESFFSVDLQFTVKICFKVRMES